MEIQVGRNYNVFAVASHIPAKIADLRNRLCHDEEGSNLGKPIYDPFFQFTIEFDVIGLDAHDFDERSKMISCDSFIYVAQITNLAGSVLFCLPLDKVSNLLNVPISLYSNNNTFNVRKVADIPIRKNKEKKIKGLPNAE
jgi:hypothetical protein